MTKHLFVALSVIALTLIGYFQFPGHTYLYADTQVYVPILEHYWNPSVLTKDLLALHPHVSFTVYDEVTLAIRRLTRLDLEAALTVQQFLFRALGILGVFLIAASLQLSARMAMLVTAIFSLGATIGGPIVLTFEYEPTPRGFAIPLLFLALGLAAHGRDLAAGVAASVSFLYQAPAGYTFWAVYFCLTLWPNRPAVMKRRILGLLPLFLSVILMLFLSRIQQGVTEPQAFFSRLSPHLEEMQRFRAPYCYVSLWSGYWFWQYGFLSIVSLAALYRLRKTVTQDLKFFLVGMPLLGLLSLPASYIALEKLKWALIPQVQPMRAVLFITALAGILAAAAAIRAVQARRYWESVFWFAAAYAVPINPEVLHLLLPNLADPLILRRFLLLLLFVGGAVLAVWAAERKARWAPAPWAAIVLIPFFLIPSYGKVANYENVETPALSDLSRWAREATAKDAVFLFPDARRQVYPGVFRVRALRNVYVDWKTGGQINFFPHLAEEWWRRWQLTMAGRFVPAHMARYASFGIDYVVVQATHRVPGRKPLFQNSSFIVYKL